MNVESLQRLCNDRDYLHKSLLSNFLEHPFNTSLPSNFGNIVDGRLSDFHILQIICVKDIGKSNRNEHDEMKYDKRMLRLSLTDGKQSVIAYEYKRILELDSLCDKNVRCLAKVALINNPVIKKGTLWLLPENVKVLFQGFKCLTYNPIHNVNENETIDTNLTQINSINNSNHNKNSILYNQKISSIHFEKVSSLHNNDDSNKSQIDADNNYLNLHNDKICKLDNVACRKVPTQFESSLLLIKNISSNLDNHSNLQQKNNKSSGISVCKTDSNAIIVEDEWEDDKPPENVFGDKLSECSFYTYIAHTKYNISLDNMELLSKALTQYSIDITHTLCKKYTINQSEIYLLASKMPHNKHIFNSEIRKESFYATISKAVILDGHYMSSQLWLLELLIATHPIIYSLSDQNTLELYCNNKIRTSGVDNVQINIAILLYNFVGYLDLSIYGYKGNTCIWLSNIKNNDDLFPTLSMQP
ncbi:hypothetical protein BMR1_03g03305 [Babesia microti strain RI]|uniref:RecQ-mediated genome instability protein 1 n=1 Tax=Babesia microti (strain RI) TaxID=1133968 RepID=A0A0K3AUJ1_BABMR|nr:hypothetical protein BMR1_03g03305 [Babesia microti strain RI]CTQ41261.1 hypothetical protein BMR1_03g03305 [Babesia microti strain RI]|eukprot:XP_012649272.1 hypothetical protein BMR1_03g03305 [Babesia microti strain RI]